MTTLPATAFTLVAESPSAKLELWRIAETPKTLEVLVIGRLVGETALDAFAIFPTDEENAADLVWAAVCNGKLGEAGLGAVEPLGPHRH